MRKKLNHIWIKRFEEKKKSIHLRDNLPLKFKCTRQWLLNEVMSHSWSLEPNSTTKYLAVGGCLSGLQHKLEVADAVVRKQLVRKGDHGLVVGLGGEAGLQDNEYKIWSMCIVPDTQI